MKLNPDQLAAVNAGPGAWCCLASAGAGKTAVLVDRYRQLAEAGELPILCLTFTRKAAQEMRERVEKLGMAGEGIRTFHSLAWEIAGCSQVEEYGALLPTAVFRLERHESERRRWQYRQVLVDEANDLTLDQVHLLQLISEKHGNVFMVGDTNQAIFGFAGATPEPMVNFQKFFPGGKYLTMGVNYRSTKRIVDFCRRLAPIQTALLEKLNTSNEEGQPITFSRHANNIAELRNAYVFASEYPEPKSVMILGRTNRQIAPLVDAGIPALTIHRSKGLETDDVWVIGAQDGLLPLGGADEEEEKRILFVAASRAAKRLHFSCYGTPSRFLTPFLEDGTIQQI